MSTRTVLIIDDDPDFVDTTQLILETEDYKVNVAYDPDEGYKKLEEETPDIILLDVMMGAGADGIKFAKKIKKDERFDKIPILVMTSIAEQTGFKFPTDPKHPKFFPIDTFLEKPVEPKVLLEEVGKLLG
jgi:CheY-like chemotaxis protein